MGQSQVRTVMAVVAAGLLLGGAVLLARVREDRYPAPPPAADSLYVTSGTALRRMTLGYQPLAADLYWIRAIQHYGGLRLTNDPHADYSLLYPLLDLTTTLDPRFNIAYRFGSIFLAEPPPGGAGRADLAIKLLEKGLLALPDKWEYMYDIGFVHYWWTHDYVAASSWFERASQVPGAPRWLPALAATTRARGGDRQTSRVMWETIYSTAEVDWLRHQAERALLQLRAMDERDQLQRLVDAEHAKTTAPVDWRALVRERRLRGIPVDPTGTPYEIDAAGLVNLGAGSPLLPLPVEPVPRQ